jgi:uncharacterized protein (DUF2141 family)
MRLSYSVPALAVVLAFGLAPGASAEPSGKLTVSVIGVRSDSGTVRCGLYSSPAGFREPGHEMRGAVAQIKNGLAACVFNALPAGTYAVAVFHAEHNETQMETACSASRSRATASPTIPPRPSGRQASAARRSSTGAAA